MINVPPFVFLLLLFVFFIFFLSLLNKVLLEILQNVQRTPVPESLFIKVVGLILQLY